MTPESFTFEPPRSFVSIEDAVAIADVAAAMLEALAFPGFPENASCSHFGVTDAQSAPAAVSLTNPPRENPAECVLVVVHREQTSRSSWKRIARAIEQRLGRIVKHWSELSLLIERPTPPNLLRAIENDRNLDPFKDGYDPNDTDLAFDEWWNRAYRRPRGLRESEISRSYAKHARKKPKNPKSTTVAVTEVMREPAAGEYWRLCDPGSAGAEFLSLFAARHGEYPDDPVALVTEVRQIDGKAHSVKLLNHPRAAYKRHVTIPISSFRDVFAYAPDGAAVRSNEIATFERELSNISAQAQRGPSRDELLSLPAQIEEEFSSGDAETDGVAAGDVEGQLAIGARLFDPVADEAVVSNLPALPAPLRRAAVGLARAKGDLALARRQGLWIGAITAEIQARATTIASFYEERAAATIASIADVRELARKLASGVSSLALYSGEDVDVELLLDGESAAASEQLHLMQARLHLDEERVVEIATGGADWTSWDDFVEELADPAMLERLLPFPRCVALMRFRRNDKMYVNFARDAKVSVHEAIGAAMVNDEENEPNREAFLLIRDGSRVFRVFSPIGTKDAKRLFPQRDELDRPFKTKGDFFNGYEGSELDFSDVRFYEATKDAEGTELFYRRLLMLMWGLQDRLGIFGRFYDPATYSDIGFLDIRLQRDRFRFVADDEPSLTLSDGSGDFQSWLASRNEKIGAGSRVAVCWDELMTRDSCPAAYSAYVRSERDYESRRYEPVHRIGIAIVHVRDGRFCVDVDVEAYGKNPRRLHVDLSRTLLDARDVRVLVLDDVRSDDLERFLRSRIARRSYIEYAALFMHARTLLLQEEASLAPLEDRLTTELCEAGYVEQDATRARAAAREAIRTWRAANAGILPDEAKALPALRALAYSAASPSIEVEGLAAAAREAGGEPVAALRSTKGSTVLVRTKAPAEALGHGLPDPWLVQATGRFARGRWALGAARFVMPDEATTNHHVSHVWSERAGELASAERPRRQLAQAPPRLRVQAWLDLLTSGAAADARGMLLCDRAAFVRRFPAGIVRGLASITTELVSRGGQIGYPIVWAPIGILRNRDERSTSEIGPLRHYSILVAQTNAWSLALAVADESERAAVQKFWQAYARNPAHHLERFASPKLTLGSTSFSVHAPRVAKYESRGLHERPATDEYALNLLRSGAPDRFPSVAALLTGEAALGERTSSQYENASPGYDVVELADGVSASLLELAFSNAIAYRKAKENVQ